MPHLKSAEKRLRQSEKRKLRNRARKKGVKLQLKAFLAALTGTDKAAMQTEFNLAVKRIDKAAAKRTIHPNAAARKKSQLALQLKAKLAPAS